MSEQLQRPADLQEEYVDCGRRIAKVIEEHGAAAGPQTARRACVVAVLGADAFLDLDTATRFVKQGIKCGPSEGREKSEAFQVADISLCSGLPGDRIDQSAALDFLEFLNQNEQMRSKSGILEIDASQDTWTAGVRRTFSRELKETIGSQGSNIVLFCPDFACLNTDQVDAGLRTLQWLAEVSGAASIIIVTNDAPAVVDWTFSLPTPDYAAFKRALLGQLNGALSVLNEMPSIRAAFPGVHDVPSSPQFAPLQNAACQLLGAYANAIFPSAVPARRLFQGIQALVKRVWVQPNEKPSEEPHKKTTVAPAEAATIFGRACFLLMLNTINPSLIGRVRRDAEGPLKLYRLQLGWLNRRRETEWAASLMDDDWQRDVGNVTLRAFFEDAFRIPEEGKPPERKPAPVVAFTSGESVREHLEFAFMLDRPKSTQRELEEWHEWLKNLAAANDVAFEERRNANQALLNQTAQKSDEKMKTLRSTIERIATLPLVPDYPNQLRISVTDRDAVAQLLRDVVDPPATIPIQRPTPYPVKPLDGLSSSGEELYGDVATGFEHAARVLMYAEYVGVGLPDSIAIQPYSDAEQKEKREEKERMDEAIDAVRSVRKHLIDYESRTKGLLRFEVRLLLSRACAMLEKFDDAETALNNEGYWGSKDALAKLMLELARAYIAERRSNANLNSPADVYMSVAIAAAEMDADEIMARAVFGQIRCRYAQQTLLDPGIARLWRAKALVSVQTERSPKLFRTFAPIRRVFISYRRRDTSDLAERMAQIKDKDDRAEAWRDVEQIDDAVQDFNPMLLMGLEAADAVIFLLSPDYLNSRWCMFEMNVALAKARLSGQRLFWLFVSAVDEAMLAAGKTLADKVIAYAKTQSAQDRQYFEDRLRRIVGHECLHDHAIQVEADGRELVDEPTLTDWMNRVFKAIHLGAPLPPPSNPSGSASKSYPPR